MANGQPKPVNALTVVSNTLEQGNGQIEGSNAHGEIVELDKATNSLDQVSMGNGSSRLSVDNSKDEFELLWRLRKYLILLAILAVSVTYNAGLTPPGGFWQTNKDGHHAGDPVLHAVFPKRYNVFFYFNATALAASLVLIILLLSKSVTRQKLWLRSMQFSMILDLFSIMGAYAAGSCRALKSSVYILVLVIAVSVYVWIHILVFIRIIPEELKNNVQKELILALSKCGVHTKNTISHQEKDVEEARKFILTLVIFAATVTYQAGLSPPGGFWAENEPQPLASPPYKYRPASSILRSKNLLRYNIFVTCNSTSFVASLVTVMLLLSPELSKHGIRSKALNVCVVFDLLFLIVAYAAGCCRDLATSFYVMFIIIAVSLSILFLAGIFVREPVAGWLKKFKLRGLRCISGLSHLLSFQHDSKRVRIDEHENSGASLGAAASAASANSASEPGHPSSDNQSFPNTDDREGEPHEEYPPSDKEKTANAEEVMPNSKHPSINNQQSASTKDVVLNMEFQSTDEQLNENRNVVMNNTEHPPLICEQIANIEDGISTENQQVARSKEQSLTGDLKSTDMPVYVKNMSDCDYNGPTNEITACEEPPDPVEAHCAEQHTSVLDDNRDTENGGTDNNVEPLEHGHIDKNQETPNQNTDANPIEKHLRKTRTYLLLLAILAVSLTYQSGMNPPGGFWSRNGDFLRKHHTAGDRILEDIEHPRFIAFFYLNAVAFVASIVMIIMLLNKTVSKKVTKRRVLQTTMIVDLLSLTGAFVMGSSREAKKSISISVLAYLVLAYVALHVLIAMHIIPREWKRQVSKKLNDFSCKHLWAALSQSEHTKGDISTDKELQRRRNLLLTLSILAATVTYQAGMNPPGSVWPEPDDPSKKDGMPGNPILQDSHPKRYDVFYYSNSISFMSSVVVTILLVNKESCEHGIKFYALRVCLVVGLLGLLIAYVAGSCRNIKQSIYLIVMAVAVLISLVVQVLLSSMHDTLGKPLAQFVEFLQKHLFPSKDSTPQKITSEIIEDSNTENKIVRKRHKYLMLLAILVASITYQAGLNPPGGLWSDDKGHVVGNSILQDINHQRYKTFFCFNSFAFMSSIVVIMLLLSKSVRKMDVPLEVLHLIMILDLLALMTAFAAGSCRKFWTSVYVYALIIGVVMFLVVLIVVLSIIAKYLRLRARTRAAFRS